MKAKKIFYFSLVTISLIGLLLRLNKYDRIPPFGETKDEFIYPWAGLSLIEKRVPESWSPFVSYPVKYNLHAWGETFTMVKPFLEKPFLYPLVTGTVAYLTGEQTFVDVRLTTIRLIPITLSVVSIFLIGLLAASVFNPTVGILASLIYATTPTIVLSNRLSLAENLLTPLVLLALYLIHRLKTHQSTLIPHVLGILSGLALHTKQIGIVLPLSLIFIFRTDKTCRKCFVVLFYTIFFGIIYLLIPALYNWTVFIRVSQELRQAHALGLPEAIFTLFRFPGIGHKESLFFDGSILAGWILLLSAPFWFKAELREKLTILAFPFVYLIFVVIGEGGQTWYGWHLFPLYPFLTILIAFALYMLWRNLDLLQCLFFILILGSSTLRFWLLIKLELNHSWQVILISGLLIILSIWQLKNLRRPLLLSLLGLYTLVNLMVVLNLDLIYRTIPQPH